MIDAVLPPPEEIKRRAWECAFDLAHGGSNVPTIVRVSSKAVMNAEPSTITWDEAGALFKLHRRFHPQRT